MPDFRDRFTARDLFEEMVSQINMCFLMAKIRSLLCEPSHVAFNSQKWKTVQKKNWTHTLYRNGVVYVERILSRQSSSQLIFCVRTCRKKAAFDQRWVLVELEWLTTPWTRLFNAKNRSVCSTVRQGMDAVPEIEDYGTQQCIHMKRW